jgi:hypothetical protein
MVNTLMRLRRIGIDRGVRMPAKSPRDFILIACACAIFWPGSFIFGLPGVLRQHWQQVFSSGGGKVGGTVFFILTGTSTVKSQGGPIIFSRALRGHEKINSHCRVLRRPAGKARKRKNIWIFRVFAPAAGRETSIFYCECGYQSAWVIS